MGRMVLWRQEMFALLEELSPARIQKVVATLPERERSILRMRYGIGDNQRIITLDKISASFLRFDGKSRGVTRERIRQIEARAARMFRDKHRYIVSA